MTAPSYPEGSSSEPTPSAQRSERPTRPTHESLPPTARPGPKLAARIALSLAFAGAFVWLLHRGGLPVVPQASAFAHVRPWTVVVYFLSLGVVHWFRAWRWDYLLRPVAQVPTRRIIAVAWIGFFAIMMLPLRMGEVVRPYLIREKGKITGSAAMGTIAAERVLDGLFVAIVLAATLVFVPRATPDAEQVLPRVFPGLTAGNVVHAGYATVALFATALVVLAFFLWQRRLAEKLTLATVGLVSRRLAERLAGMVGGLADGLRSLPDAKLMGPFFLQTAVYWGVNGLGMWLLGWGCGLDMGVAVGFAVMGVLAMGILLPAGPGLFGTFQASIFVALRLYFSQQRVHESGEAYVFIMYAAQAVFTTLAGVLAMRTQHLHARDMLGGEAEAAAA